MSKISLKLYIAGKSVKSESAIRNLKHLLKECVGNNYDLEVIDVIENPALAEEQCVLATPTLIRIEPLSQRRIIGDLSDRHALISGLDLESLSSKNSEFVRA